MIGSARGVSAVIGLGLAILPGGCALTESPALRVADARVVQQTASAAVVEFDIEASNDGPDPLPLREVSYSLDAGGQRVFSGTRAPQVTVPSQGRIIFTLPVSLPMALSGEPVGYVLRGSVSYVAPGPLADAMYDNGVRRPSVSFRDAGTLVGDQQIENQQSNK